MLGGFMHCYWLSLDVEGLIEAVMHGNRSAVTGVCCVYYWH